MMKRSISRVFTAFLEKERFSRNVPAFSTLVLKSVQLFYSCIGLNQGKVPILGGARITGMAGKWDIGFLDMQTNSFDPSDTSKSSLPSENFGILRLRRQVINQNCYLGGIFASRMGIDGSYNISYGVDGIFKLFRNDYFNFKLAQVMAQNATNILASGSYQVVLQLEKVQ
jgi:hypothetical protein